MSTSSLQKLQDKNPETNLSEFKNDFPVRLGDICDQLGIIVDFKNNMEDDKYGLIRYKDDKYRIDINNNQNIYKNLFTIAHELGHYCLHDKELKEGKEFSDRKNSGYTKEEWEKEKEANHFAAQLLMPEDKFIEKFNEYKGDYNLLQNFFRVSREAVNYRAINLGLIFA